MSIRKILALLPLLIVGLLLRAPASRAQDTNFDWPREIDSPIGQIIIYEPQPDSLDGDIMTGRAAVSLHRASEQEPVFGALWFHSQVAVDRDAGTVTIENIQVLRARFPDAQPDELEKFTSAVEAAVPEWELVMSVEQLEAGMAASAQELSSTENLKTDPPQVIFSQKPAVLVSFDGEPELRPIENSPYLRVVNTAFLIIQDKSSGKFYLSNGQAWYVASNPKGPWNTIGNPPQDIKKLVPPDKDAAPAEPNSGPAPSIITATTPTELVVTDGAPKWTPLTGNELLYVSNTETTWVKEITTNKHYVLLSGRWYSSPSMDGPWAYQRSDQLPSSFKKIAPASPIGDALASVAGTNQAEDAVMDSQIPQTAAVKRSEAKTEVSYDGDPQFQLIPSTDIQYAVNTDSSVLLIGGRYYVCDNAIWFAGLTPNGPWTVADSVPDVVKTIPPSSPVYNVRYVQVYESTPDIVYVGYTPGYIGTYRYYGTVVYGTGWVYRPWIGPRYYYPRPFTWGFHVVYNPYSGGWGYALGYSTSFINVSIGWGNRYYHRPTYWSGGWWGPGGYRPVYRPRPGYRPPHYRPPSNARPIVRPRPGRPGIRPPPRPRDNIYAQPVNKGRVTRDVPKRGRIPKPAKGPDNVYTDKDGNVIRRDNKGNWQKRENGKWNPTKPPAQPPATRPTPKPNPRPKPTPPTTQPAPNPAKPGTRPAPARPNPRPTPPSAQPVKPTEPPTTRPTPRPNPRPKPTPPTAQPVPNPEKPETKPARPRPRPTPPTTQPAKPAELPATRPTPRPNPRPKPAPPTAQPAPNQERPATRPAPARPRPAPPAAQPEKPSGKPAARPAPKPKPQPKPVPPAKQPEKKPE